VRYPPAPLSSSSTLLSGYPYGNGQYVVSSSSEYYPAEYNWRAFNTVDNHDCSIDHNMWTVSKVWYYTASGSYAGSQQTVISGGTYSGEWLQIKLPQPIVLKKYALYTRGDSFTRGPKIFHIAGSDDGLTWTLVDSRDDDTLFSEGGKSYDLANATTTYTHYRIVVTAKLAGESWLSICEWVLLGSDHTQVRA
jgi:hypothetical protein